MVSIPQLTRKAKSGFSLFLRRPKGLWPFWGSVISALPKSSYNLGKPISVTIEPNNICNLECPVCETGASIMRRPRGQMSLENFKKVVDQIAPFTNSMLLYFMGEPMMNRQIYDMIRYAKSKGIFTTISTNGHFLEPDAVIGSGLDDISFQIGGTTQEAHQTYRVKSELSLVLKNCRALVEAKRRHDDGKVSRGGRPKIKLGFIVMKHNEHQVDEFLALAREIGVDEANVDSPCVRTFEQGLNFLTQDKRYWEYDQLAFENGILKTPGRKPNRCNYIYFSNLITWNGDVLPCCRDANGEWVMGNLLTQDFESVWNGPRYRAFRDKIATEQENVGICRLCNGYPIPNLRDA